MLVLNASDTVAGSATTATTVTYTLAGSQISGGATTYEKLAQGQLATSAATVYTVPNSTQAQISEIFLANTGPTLQTVIMYVSGTAVTNQIIGQIVLPANGSATFDRDGWKVYDGNGTLQVGSTQVSLYYNVHSYGATGNGVTDDTIAIQAAYTAAYNAGGGIVFLPPGTYNINGVNGLSWASGTVGLLGSGIDASVLAAGAACTSQVLNITNPKRGFFQDFTVLANGHASNGIVQSVAAETSVGTRFFRVSATGATGSGAITVGSSYPGYNWVNLKCEDNSYIDCYTGANEGSASTVQRCFAIYIPAGAYRVLGGELFGRHDIVAQQATYVGGTYGPFVMETNPTYSLPECVLALEGCYIYDGGIDSNKAITGPNGLYTVKADGCYLVQQTTTSWVQGAIGAGVHVSFRNCVWFQGAATGTTVNLLNISGTGVATIEGGSVIVSNATTVNLATGTGPIVRQPILCKGVSTGTGNGTTRLVTAPTFPATTVAQTNTFGATVTAYVNNGVGLVSAIAINGTTVTNLTIPANEALGIDLQPGDTIAFTYLSGSPTWAWVAK